MRDASSGHLSRSRAAQARLPRPIRERSPCWRTHESHRPALELLPATVRGAPDVRSAVHPPTALVCWQVQGARRAPMAPILRHHRGGARHAPPVSPVDDTGTAPTTRTRLLSTVQPDHRLHSMRGRRLSGAAVEAALDGCQVAARGNLVGASRSSRRPPSCYRGAAPVAGRPMGCPRLGRQQVVEPADPSRLAGLPGPTAEPVGLWSPWASSRVRV